MDQARRQALTVGYVGLVAAVAGAAGAALVRSSGVPHWQDVILFWGIHCAAHWSPVVVPPIGPRAVEAAHKKPPMLSAGFLVLVLACFSLPPASAAFVGALSPIGPRNWRGAKRTLFNAAQGAIYTGLASLVFNEATAMLGQDVWALLLASVLGATTAVLLNTGLVSSVVALESGRRFLHTWWEFAWPTANSLVVVSLAGLVVSQLYTQLGPLAAVFLLTPIVVLRHTRLGRVELQQAHERTLRALVRAVELKDPFTSRHSERVAEIVTCLHREIGCSERYLVSRYYGALVHDIGKVGVPSRILSKPSSLSAQEFEAVKMHPEIGANVLEDVKFLSDVIPEILYHHERIDGNGYPFGISGDDIPFEARVLAVADTFEALTSDRPYRTALTDREALREIQRCVGTQFDPGAVNALERLLVRGHRFSLPLRKPLEGPVLAPLHHDVPGAVEA